MRPFADPNDRYSYEDWMNEMGADEGLPELPPMGHPLQKLGARLGELLDEDHWAECERLLLEGWAALAREQRFGSVVSNDSGRTGTPPRRERTTGA